MNDFKEICDIIESILYIDNHMTKFRIHDSCMIDFLIDGHLFYYDGRTQYEYCQKFDSSIENYLYKETVYYPVIQFNPKYKEVNIDGEIYREEKLNSEDTLFQLQLSTGISNLNEFFNIKSNDIFKITFFETDLKVLKRRIDGMVQYFKEQQVIF